MKIFFSLFLLLPLLNLNAQYFYKDIITTIEMNRQMNLYKTNKVLTVTASGYDPQGNNNPDFSEVQQLLLNTNTLKISTQNNPSNSVILLQVYDKDNRLIKVTDSAADVQSTTLYTYDMNGRIAEIKNITTDTSQSLNETLNETEVHKWFYNESSKPIKMQRIVNNNDITEFKFTLDEKGNVLDERSFKNGIEGEMTYYYYDDKNRLTDIVRYNAKLKKLMPDYLFEYNESDQVIQKITTLSNLNFGYLIWRYAFNEKGLKTKEALSNKEKVMTGRIEYNYTFAQ